MVEKWRSLQKVVMDVANGINMQTTTQKINVGFYQKKAKAKRDMNNKSKYLATKLIE